MSISEKDIKLLWGRSGNRCAICRAELSSAAEHSSSVFPVGQQAHIVAEEPGGPRGESILSPAERNSYYNLILLCSTHHTIIDKDLVGYPVEKLYRIKAKHELWVVSTLSKYSDRHVVPRQHRSMAPPIEGFVQRREYERTVGDLIDVSINDEHLTVGITTTLRGSGGFGKTALAQAVCQDTRIQEAFTGGILWAQMKESIDDASLLGRVIELIRWFTGEDPPHYESVIAAAASLRELLADQKVLVVVDDAWYSEHVRPFRNLGARGSALLVTTRDSRTLPYADIKIITVDAMHISEAIKLLGANLAELEDPLVLKNLAYRLGEWPLLLKLVNRYIAKKQSRGLSLAEAIFEAEEALGSQGLTAFDSTHSGQRDEAVERTLEVSVKVLSTLEQESFFSLAVFPEDADIPLSVVANLWQCAQFKASGLCESLYDLSLLLRFDRRSGADTIRLHDVFRSYLLKRQRDNLITLHRRLLDSYEPIEGQWRLLPKEEIYIWKHLADHLLGANQRDRLRDLLLDFSFLEAKLQATDINQLISDAAKVANEFPRSKSCGKYSVFPRMSLAETKRN